ncbi:TetR family transcriptional regulator [Alkalibaculum sp. M08DMB]|uniref:TetR family transcriptional regulator n=1 Tax=Alkalibaculum sporogenes TaxID=2655001 RepID=A0A6A7KBK3_9FIRM|nr:helix-turn-helix domain-containing protein [Alkalibaculum sporogenes]MPW26939.1 TetR family transcriptional regulator [Alkalibaculum sporogenes]
MRYKKGFETKENIINVSKKLFYELGYTKATVQNIADTAQIPLGLIPYYFKTKDNIVLEINSKFYLEIYEFVNSRLNVKKNSYYKLFVVTCIYYRIILEDPRNKKFFYEVLRNKSNFRALSYSIERIYSMISKENNNNFSQIDLDCIMIAEFGARRELLLYYFEDKIDIDVDYLVKMLSSVTGRFFSIPNELIAEYAENEKEFTKEYDYSHIKFLV